MVTAQLVQAAHDWGRRCDPAPPCPTDLTKKAPVQQPGRPAVPAHACGVTPCAASQRSMAVRINVLILYCVPAAALLRSSTMAWSSLMPRILLPDTVAGQVTASPASR